MEDVRLTVQIRDQRNHIRTTMHRDVPINKVAEKARELATEQSKMFRKEQARAAAAGEEK